MLEGHTSYLTLALGYTVKIKINRGKKLFSRIYMFVTFNYVDFATQDLKKKLEARVINGNVNLLAAGNKFCMNPLWHWYSTFLYDEEMIESSTISTLERSASLEFTYLICEKNSMMLQLAIKTITRKKSDPAAS